MIDGALPKKKIGKAKGIALVFIILSVMMGMIGAGVFLASKTVALVNNNDARFWVVVVIIGGLISLIFYVIDLIGKRFGEPFFKEGDRIGV